VWIQRFRRYHRRSLPFVDETRVVGMDFPRCFTLTADHIRAWLCSVVPLVLGLHAGELPADWHDNEVLPRYLRMDEGQGGKTALG